MHARLCRLPVAYLGYWVAAVLSPGAVAAPSTQPAVTWALSFNDPNATYQSYYAEIQSNFMAAANEWSTHLVSPLPRTIDVQVRFLPDVVRSSGHSATSAFVSTVGGVNVFAQGFVYKIATGHEPNNITPDVYLDFQPDYLANNLWFDPDPAARTAPVPNNRTDAYSVIIHELTHAIAFNGWRDSHTGTLPGSPPYESTFDINETFDGTNFYFTGPRAEAIYGGPVPVTYGDNFHVGNSPPRPGYNLLYDLMNGIVFYFGRRYDLSALDLAIATDAFAPTNFIPGDANADGNVGFDDLVALAQHYGVSSDATLSMGDFNSDGKVDFKDLVMLAQYYGQSFPGAFGPPRLPGTATAIPEPASFILLPVCAIAAGRRSAFSVRRVVN